MPARNRLKQYFKFKVGDVVYVPWREKEKVLSKRGVVVAVEDVEDFNSFSGLSSDPNFTCIGGNRYEYIIEMFDKEFKNLSYFMLSEWKRCEGMKDTKLCDKCEDRFQCWTNRRVDH